MGTTGTCTVAPEITHLLYLEYERLDETFHKRGSEREKIDSYLCLFIVPTLSLQLVTGRGPTWYSASCPQEVADRVASFSCSCPQLPSKGKVVSASNNKKKKPWSERSVRTIHEHGLCLHFLMSSCIYFSSDLSFLCIRLSSLGLMDSRTLDFMRHDSEEIFLFYCSFCV